MSTRLIFVRHGYSQSNELGLFTGQSDICLTELGKKQAFCAAKYLEDIKIDKIYSSTLCRAIDTARAVALPRGMEVLKLYGLCEIDAGDWTELTFDEIIKNYPDEYTLWKNDMYKCCCPNGENVADFAQRVTDTVNQIAKENEGKTVLIASHATPIRVICCLALGIDLKNLRDIPWSPNASINIIDWVNGDFVPVQRDIVEHLKGFETALPSNI